MKRKFLFSAAAIALLTACGTVISGSTQNISFNSNVRQVQIFVNGELVCNSVPCSAEIDRASGSLMIMARARGYEDNIMNIRSQINTTSFFNFFSIYFWTTDLATGSIWKYSRDGIYINMRRAGMQYGEAEKFKKDSAIRHFVLHNYPELRTEAYKGENGEYVQALSSLTKQNGQTLINKINDSYGEVQLAHSLAL